MNIQSSIPNIEIDGYSINEFSKPFLIAEMSNNHLGDLELAKEIMRSAKDHGADAIKLQSYTADSLTIDCKKQDFEIQDKLWKGQYYYDLYKKISMPLDWHKELFNYGKALDLTVFSSPFDDASLQLLLDLDCPALKIASFEACDPGFVGRILAANKPTIISTGICNEDDLERLSGLIEQSRNQQVALLHCISEYPSQAEDMNLFALKKLSELSPIFGISDHSLSNIPSIISTTLGGRIVEKHFTIARAKGGPDAAFSIEPIELKKLRSDIDLAFNALGSKDIFAQKVSRKGSHHGRSIYIVQDVKAGDEVSEKNVRVIRPGFGMPPWQFENVIGKKFSKNLERGTALDSSMIA